ncbi:T9SS type A sorting domain-containing protein [Pontibacter ruber]|uniref:T9SS type A sorting domain-containing protein n=1 Tax=Pontibacter ruber TaxID=1343895 RepID=UPI0020293966|nr:T9SS type A sorting domain-containing protein [Pontibacter ruber]
MKAHSTASSRPEAGVAPAYKGGSTLWKLMPEKKAGPVVSAQNAAPAFVLHKKNHTCSPLYASAVGEAFHAVESAEISKSMYAVTLASIAPGRDIKPVPSISAYPNPSRGITKLTLSQTSGDNYKIRISNTIGKVVEMRELHAAETNSLELDMRGYPAGVYFYSLLVNDKTVETKRLILQK